MSTTIQISSKLSYREMKSAVSLISKSLNAWNTATVEFTSINSERRFTVSSESVKLSVVDINEIIDRVESSINKLKNA